MSNEIDILMGGGMTPQQTDTQAAAAMLRGQLNEGNALGLSTIGGVADFGKSQSKQARAGAREAGRLKQALEKEARSQEEVENKEKRMLKKAIAKQKRDMAAQIAKEKRTTAALKETEDRALEDWKTKQDYAKSLISKDVESNKLKPTGKAVQDYTKARNLHTQIGSINESFAKLDKDQVKMLNQPLTDALTDTFVPATMERYVQDQFIYNDPDVKNYRAKLADVESEFSRLMSGLAVTGFEMTDRQKWSPYAAGIEQSTRNARLKNLSKKLGTQISTAEATYKLGNIAEQALGNPQDVVQMEVMDEIEEQAPEFLQTREINGVNYGQTEDGNWVVVE